MTPPSGVQWTISECQPHIEFAAPLRAGSDKLTVNPIIMSSFDAAQLQDHRKKANLSQRALALKAGVSQALIAEIERGKHPPSAASLSKIAAALGLSPEDFET